jgi:peptidoglycan/LPS O-acetylase OafA/YrhL
MPISIIDPIFSTKVFIAVFIFFALISLRPKKDSAIFPLGLTQELKGLAILAVVFSHVGYFLSSDQRFMFPFSILAGVGVNLFLFLSGYGISMSMLKKKLSPFQFYQKRFLKLLIPFWLVISIFFILDHFFLHISYSWPYIVKSLLGFFPRADLYHDINSPFWFITPIIFYYLIFPFIFSVRRPWLSAIIICIASSVILRLKLPVSEGVMNLYQTHFLAFPLGVAFASFFTAASLSRLASIKSFIQNLKWPARAWKKISNFCNPRIIQQSSAIIKWLAYYGVMATLLIFIAYFSYNSGVGSTADIEQLISLVTVAAIVLLFMIKKWEIKLFHIFGFYAYEVYLLHWPLMYRYDIFFKYLPGWLAMSLYLLLFLALSWVVRKICTLIDSLKFSR